MRAILLLIPLLGVVNLFYLLDGILPDIVYNILRFILISTQVIFHILYSTVYCSTYMYLLCRSASR